MNFLKIASTNIRFQNALDGRFDWSFRRELLSEVILEFSPDLLASQEGRRPQLEDYESLISPLKMIQGHREWIENRMYPCIFYNLKTIEVIDSGDTWLSETPNVPGTSSFGSSFPRLCSWAHLKHKESDFEFAFISTHLDHTDTDIRQKQIDVLLNELNTLRDKLPLVLAGDFNEGTHNGVYKKVISKWNLTDPWIELAKPEEGTHFKFSGGTIDAKRIDWILTSNEFQSESIELDKRSKGDIFPSDHYPLLLKTRLP